MSGAHLETPARGSSGLWMLSAALLLRQLRSGRLLVETPDGRLHTFEGATAGRSARIRVNDPAFARRLLLGGHMAFAEGYIEGAWDTPDLSGLLALGMDNLQAGFGSRLPLVRRPLERIRHALRDNDPSGGARKNIAEHYDLGNEFYRLWLDDTMTYSSGCSLEPGARRITPEQLTRAQINKWDRILDLVQPQTRDHVLEIGCGWGGFAIHAAKAAGCRVTGLTLSTEQAAFARERVQAEGLEGRVDIRLQDYRHVVGQFDGIASIEMFEAVGERWWPVFFGRLRELLRPGAAAALQTITIAERAFEEYRRDPDFIQHYIFPGGMLPSPERFRCAAESAGLRVCDPQFFGSDYALTIKAWSERFEAALPQVMGLGFDDRFVRMWRYYLDYCRTGFESGSIDVMQVRMVPSSTGVGQLAS